MANKQFDDYEIANISAKEEQELSKLEQSMRNETNKDVVLIAYQPKERAKA